jgi:hypothetical protein
VDWTPDFEVTRSVNCVIDQHRKQAIERGMEGRGMSEIDSTTLAAEKVRFNALSQEDARRIAREVDGSPPAMRSCWYCNGAHERLKEADYFTCFACGISFVRGYPTPILGMRMRGEEITEEAMGKLAKALSEGD